jgi:Tfp pilus assembly protein PilF
MTLAAALTLGLAVLAATPPANLPQALEAQRRLVADRPSDAAAHNDLGNLLLLAGDEAGAEAAYRRAVELTPDHATYRYNLALLLQETDRPHRALDELRRSAELDPTNAWAAYQVGALYEAQGRRRAAVEWYGRAFRLNPDLAFSDVNPHVIESELTAEAMLRGYDADATIEHAAPRIYQEPGRISSLLVPPPGVVEPPPVPPADGREPARTAGGGGGQARPPVGSTAGSTAPRAPLGDEPERRVLREEDLPTGPVNQAAPQVAPGYQPPTRRGGGTTVILPGQPAQPGDGRQAPRQPVEAPNERVIVPRGGAPYRPGLPSTGSLDTVLFEETERRG